MDQRRKRLLFQSAHRGTKEMDLVLGRFAACHLAELTTEQLDRYEALLQGDDAEIFDWISGRAPVPPTQDHDVLNMIKNFKVYI